MGADRPTNHRAGIQDAGFGIGAVSRRSTFSPLSVLWVVWTLLGGSNILTAVERLP
jgi:hypothetical protein